MHATSEMLSDRLTVVPVLNGSLNLSDPATRLRLTPSAVEGMIRLCEIWRLGTEEACLLLGDMSERTWFRLKRPDGPRAPPPQGPGPPEPGSGGGGRGKGGGGGIRVLVGIFKGRRLLFSEPLADDWIRLPNKGALFGGRSPLTVAIERGIPGLLEIRWHVDALRGGL